MRSLIALAVVGAALLGAASSAGNVPLSSEFFGMNVNRVFYDDPSPSHEFVLGAARAAGAARGRLDLTWSIVEPNAPAGGVHKMVWRTMDARVAALARAGIRPTPILGYSARWAADGATDKSPPANDADFVDYAIASAERYGPQGSFWRGAAGVPYLPVRRWEIWNEENVPHAFWRTGRDAARYARLYVAAHDAIHAVDGEAQVIVGGLAGDDVAYVAEMQAAYPDLRDHLDGVAFHPYGRTVAAVLARIRRFQAGVDRTLGYGVPIQITEVGWHTNGSGAFSADDASRAANLSLLTDAVARSNCGIDAYEPYAWLTAERDPGDMEHWWGIWSPFSGELESAGAWAAAVRRYATPAAMRRARSRGWLLPVCGRPWPGAAGLRLGVVASHERNGGGPRLFRITVTYLGRPLEGAVVSVRPPRQHGFRRTTDPRGNARIAFMPGTRVWAHLGQVASSRLKTLR